MRGRPIGPTSSACKYPLRLSSLVIVLGARCNTSAMARALLPCTFIAMITPRSSALSWLYVLSMTTLPLLGAAVLHFTLESAQQLMSRTYS
jgi:hypothetical protein